LDIRATMKGHHCTCGRLPYAIARPKPARPAMRTARKHEAKMSGTTRTAHAIGSPESIMKKGVEAFPHLAILLNHAQGE
jgi:hypothetical protein